MSYHVFTWFLGYAAFAVSCGSSIACLIKNRKGNEPSVHKPGVLPTIDLVEEVIYQANAVGFMLLGVGIITGAVWANYAWGSYWSWDPKETWALIVWLNYAAWLHLRLTKGWRGRPLAWWAIVGLFVTLFAFVGVNMFLSGLHSYGEL